MQKFRGPSTTSPNFIANHQNSNDSRECWNKFNDPWIDLLVPEERRPVDFDPLPYDVRQFYKYLEMVREMQRLMLKYSGNVPAIAYGDTTDGFKICRIQIQAQGV